MARRIIDCPPAPTDSNPWKHYEKIELTVQVVTPMFGGGVEPGVPDPVTLIRVPSIRGHLRFWWRATRGANHQDVKTLRDREAEIWGDTENPSPVQIEVASPKWDHRRRPDDPYNSRGRQGRGIYGFRRFGPEGYALFSAYQNKADVVKEDFSFGLTVRWPEPTLLQKMRDRENERLRHNRKNKKLLPQKIDDITTDVHVSLAAWLSYGGIGARTRRGCGSLLVVNSQPLLPSDPLLRTSIRLFYKRSQYREALEAWNEAVHVYQAFRQSPRGDLHNKVVGHGRTARVPGRSRWPEPDSIRQLTGCALNQAGGNPGVPDDVNTHDHTTPVVPPEILPAFPKAMLGLPTVFHYADSPRKGRPADRNLDPQDVELVPEFPDILDREGNPTTGTRMASPVITRPVYHQSHWRAAIILLPKPSLLGARLRGKLAKWHDGRPTDLDIGVSAAQITGKSLAPLEPMRGQEDALEALISYIGKQGFEEEVVR